MGVRPLIDGAERRRRIGARHRIDPACRADSVLAAAEAVACLHGTDHPSIYLSAFARSWTDAAAIDAALFEQRSLVKHLAMRRTVFRQFSATGDRGCRRAPGTRLAQARP